MFRVGDKVICIGWDDIPKNISRINQHVLEHSGFDKDMIYTVTDTHKTNPVCSIFEIIINEVIILDGKYFRKLEDIRDEKIDDLLNGDG